MTTKLHDVVEVEADGLVRLCAWCVERERSIEIHRAYEVSDGLCPDCRDRFERETA